MKASPNIFFTASPLLQKQLYFNGGVLELAKKYGFSIRLNPYASDPSEEQWIEMLSDVEALITTWHAPRLTERLLSKNSVLKIVGHAAGSVAEIVSPGLFRRGIKIVSANCVLARSVAEWSVMMTILGLRRVTDHAQFGLFGKVDWQKRESGKGIHDAIIGIVGFGDIANHLVHFLKPLSPQKIIVSDDFFTLGRAEQLNVEKVSLDELFDRSDVIHMLTGLNENTKYSIGSRQLQSIRTGATLINAGRAALIEPNAFLAELQKKRFSAILDVHYQEPLPETSPFRMLDNVILTPHSAAYGCESALVRYILEEFARFFSNEPLQNEINEQRAKAMTNHKLVFSS